ncbi:MAG: DUF108 domain-containing protein [Nocardioidaceae bacterium]|nr:DUF108 domain-containing protein [Nocardioidaceae bacterium]
MRRVVVAGYGVIGSQVAGELAKAGVPGAELVGIVDSRVLTDPPAPQCTLSEALHIADVVVECAGQPAVHEMIDPVLGGGADLVVTSVGALLDERLGSRLGSLGPGRLLGTHGAVGGLDLLASVARAGGLDVARLRTTKKSASLVREWMTRERTAEILAARDPITVFSGSADEAARLFPDSLNVVAALATAVGSTQLVEVELVGDPTAPMTTHEITAEGDLGDYCFTIRNTPSNQNPRTSAVTAWSVLHTVASLTDRAPLIA